MPDKLGNYLKGLRGSLSLREAASRSNGKLSHNAIAQAEKGVNSHGKEYIPSPSTLKELARIYGADYQKLMELAGYITLSNAERAGDFWNNIEKHKIF